MRSRVRFVRGRGGPSSPSFRGRRPWNPIMRGTRPTVDARGSPSPPSSSRSGDPPVRGRAVRHRYPGGTNRGIPAQSARMTAEFESASSLLSATNRGILRLLAQALNDVQKCKCAVGCGSSVDAEAKIFRHSEAAGRGIP